MTKQLSRKFNAKRFSPLFEDLHLVTNKQHSDNDLACFSSYFLWEFFFHKNRDGKTLLDIALEHWHPQKEVSVHQYLAEVRTRYALFNQHLHGREGLQAVFNTPYGK